MLNSKLARVRPRRSQAKVVVPAPVLLTLVFAVAAFEVVLIFLLPFLTARYERQVSRTTALLENPPIVSREMESLRMIPPAIGVMYRRRIAKSPSQTGTVFSRLLLANDGERLRLIRQPAMTYETYLGVLRRCYGGGPAEERLEEFLVQNAAAISASFYAADGAWLILQRNYFYAGERAQYAGLIDDARRDYRRFIELGRMLNRKAALGIEMQRQLNTASVRLKILSPELAFETITMNRIQEGPAEAALRFIHHPDPRLAALARYDAASFLWHAGRGDDADKLLAAGDCGVLKTECKFLRAKILDAKADESSGEQAVSARAEARLLVDELIRTLPDDHPLLDDIYFHRALAASQRDDKAGVFAALREIERRCPHTDLVADMKHLREDVPGRTADE